MPAKSGTKSDVELFLSQRRLAVVGVSRHDNEYSRLLFRELAKHGYDVTPVNPGAQAVDGVRCYARVADVVPAVDGVLILLPAEAAEAAVLEAVEAGVTQIWSRHEPPAARELCRERGVSLVAGYCPFMFLENGGFMHQCHGFAMRLVGKYPS